MTQTILTTPRHINTGNCAKCEQILRRYPGFHVKLWDWFTAFQSKHPEAHISCAGRGEQDQMEAYFKKASKAEWGASAHNYNAALDLFHLEGSSAEMYARPWFEKVLAPNLAGFMKWYGAPGSPFPELCHVEVSSWKTLVKAGALTLVEQPLSYVKSSV